MKTFKSLITVVALSVAAFGSFLVSAPCAKAQLINNGNFDTPPPAGNTAGSLDSYASFKVTTDTTVAGWNFGYEGTGNVNARVEWYSATQREGWNASVPASATYAIELNSDAKLGRLWAQPTFSEALTIGDEYILTLSVAPETNWREALPTETQVEISIDGVSTVESLPVKTPAGENPWKTLTYIFRATSTSPDIRFYDGIMVSGTNSNWSNDGQAGADVNIAKVSLTLVPTPEPAAYVAVLLLMITGGWAERKRLRTLVARTAQVFGARA